MLTHIELDPTYPLASEYSDPSDETTILVNIFDVDPAVRSEFMDAWLIDADFFKAQPGYVSAQLHQGIEGSRIFVNYAVFENTASFAATNRRPEFGPLRAIYPDGATAHPHLFRRVAVPGICVGETSGTTALKATEQPRGLNHVELDPTFSLERQYGDDSGQTTVLLNLFDVDPGDHEYFIAAWRDDAEFFKAQPGYISSQLHKGIGDSRLFLNYAVFENTASFAATNRQPEFGPLRKIYPDSATAHPHLLRRLAIPGICVGEGNRRHLPPDRSEVSTR
jgi:heme-degrading monooxygenase HmoA